MRLEDFSIFYDLFFCVFRFFYGKRGAFTLFEATPEFLYISQIDDNANEVHKAQLKPRNSATAITAVPKAITTISWGGFSKPWGIVIGVSLALVGTLGGIGFSRALWSKRSRNKIQWTRLPEELNEDQDCETENLS